MSYPALKITESTSRNGWREVGQMGWQYAFLHQLVQAGIWSTLKGSQMSVLGVLLSHANTQGQAWPQTATLRRLSGLSKRSVELAIDELVRLELIEKRPADDELPRDHYQFLRCSGWAADGHVMASASDVPAPAESPGIAQPVALAAQPRAPQAQPTAHKAQPVALALYEENKIEQTTATAPPVQSPPPAHDDTPGLFDAAAAVSMLIEKSFQPERAKTLVEKHGVQRVRDAITNTDWLKAQGKIRTSYCQALTAFLKHGYSLDPRIEQEAAAARRRDQDRAAAAQANRRAPAPKPAAATPILTGDARTIIMREGRVIIDKRGKIDRHAARSEACKQLLAEGWTREQLERAINELQGAKHGQ